jgi:hypothetical protein
LKRSSHSGFKQSGGAALWQAPLQRPRSRGRIRARRGQ